MATAAVIAVISEMERIDAPATARRQGHRLSTALAEIDGIATVRGAGLLLGAVLDGVAAADVTRVALQHGLIVNAVAADTIRLAPPLTVSDAEIDEAAAILANSIHEVSTGGDA